MSRQELAFLSSENWGLGLSYHQFSYDKLPRRISYRAAAQARLDNIETPSMRKLFAYHAYQQTKDTTVIQHVLNHSSPSATNRYLCIDDDEVRWATLNNKGDTQMENPTIKNINDLTAFIGCDDTSDIVETVYNRAKGGVFVVLQDNGIILCPNADGFDAEANDRLLYPFTAKQ